MRQILQMNQEQIDFHRLSYVLTLRVTCTSKQPKKQAEQINFDVLTASCDKYKNMDMEWHMKTEGITVTYTYLQRNLKRRSPPMQM